MTAIDYFKENTEYVLENLSHEELLLQLAEECAELGHAALKMRRVMDGKNPTPQNIHGAIESVNEEIADVMLVMKILGYEMDDPNRQRRMENKLARWCRRLWERALEK